MFPALARFTLICALLAAQPPATAQVESSATSAQTEPPIISAHAEFSPESKVVFASRGEGSAIMASRDDYIARMSRFDRMLRLKSTQTVSEREYLDFLAANVLEWTDSDKSRLRSLLQKLRVATQQYRLPLPSTVLLIKTTGKEEVGQAHTRANAIVLPERSLEANDEALLFLLSHELFHVMSRHDENFRQRAYGLVGFRLDDEISLPDSIAPLQITNPDAPRHDSYIDLTSDGRKTTVVPVLLSRSAVFDPQLGYELDQYWTLRLLVVEQASPGDAIQVVVRNGAPVLLKLNEVEGFMEKVGKNTGYVIHAEEILAENFALLVTGADVAQPERLEALRQILVPE